MKNTLKFAIIGMGFIFKRHVDAISAVGGEIKLTCDIDNSKNPDFTDWIEMFNHPSFEEIDIVVICAPNYLHSTMAREALIRGKKVLCEKPLSINGVQNMDGVFTVLQLRNHPEINKIKNPKNVSVEAVMFRDNKYWESWKGDTIKSGGILFNLGIHYIDILIYLLGNNWEIINAEKTDTSFSGELKFGESTAKFKIATTDNRAYQHRTLTVDGLPITLSNQDNLSYEDLHKIAYYDFLSGKGITLEEANKSIHLVNAVLAFIDKKGV